MKFLFFLIMTSFVSVQIAHSQTCQWAQKIAGSNTEDSYCIVADDSGNVYIAGEFNSPILNFNSGIALSNSSTDYDIYLAKYSAGGTCQWAFKVSGTGNDVVRGIALDSSGNVYISGRFNSPDLKFSNSISLTNNGSDDAFFAKYNSSGDCIWAQSIHGEGSESASSIAIDGSGNVLVFGYYIVPANKVLTFNNGKTLPPSSSSDIFLARYSSNGICQWAQQIGGNSSDYGNCVSVDASENIYIAGYFGSSVLNFNNFFSLANSGSYDGFVAKYNSSGTCRWAQKISGNSTEYVNSVTIDNLGNVFVAGNYSSPTVNFNNNITLISRGGSDAYFVKYNSNGTCQQAQRISGTAGESAYCIALDDSGNVYIAGYFSSPTLYFNNGITLTNDSTNYKPFITKYNSGLNCLWAQMVHGALADYSTGISLDSYGNIYTSGYFRSDTIFFDSTISLSNSGSNDAFIAKYIQPSSYSITTSALSSLNYCQGTPISVSFTISGTYQSSNTFTAQLSDHLGNFSNPTTIGTLSGADAGTITTNLSISTYLGIRYRIRVVSSNPPIIGTDNGANISVKALPLLFNLTGGGSACSGGSGVPVGLSGSQMNVKYQLKLNGANSGSPVNGTGNLISFGNQKTSGTFTVVGTNNITTCPQTMSGNVIISINPLPLKFNLTGGGGYCDGDQGVLIGLDSSESNISYQLKLDSTNIGNPIIGTGSAIDFGYQNQIGKYTVAATNTTTNCTSMMSGAKDVTKIPIPPKPTITQNGNDLTSSAETGNQWYLNSLKITGATNKIHTATLSGKYSVIETQNNCSSPMSDLLDVVVVDVYDNSNVDNSVSIIPSPNNGYFTLRIDNLPNTEMIMTLVNSIGQEVYSDKLTTTNDSFTKEINLSKISSGIYFLKLRFGEKAIVKQIVITK